MEGRNRDPLVKVSVVTGARNVEAVVWRRRQSVMSEQDVDDVAFLTGISLHFSCRTCPRFDAFTTSLSFTGLPACILPLTTID